MKQHLHNRISKEGFIIKAKNKNTGYIAYFPFVTKEVALKGFANGYQMMDSTGTARNSGEFILLDSQYYTDGEFLI